jgi:ribonuclease HII
MPNARRSAGSIEDPVRSLSEARRGRTVSAPGSAAGRLQVAPWHKARLDPDFAEERILWSRGYRHVAGILPPAWQPRGLRDSKLLKPEERRRLDVEIRRHAVAWAIAFVSPELIDRINILQATLLASTLAAARLPVRPDALLLDAVALPEVRVHQRVLVSADRLCASVAAASVIAKVARDALMVELDAIYPGYDLAGNKGYAAPEHRAGLAVLGLCPIHRLSFAPCRDREQMTLWQDAQADANADDEPDEPDEPNEIDEPDDLEVAEFVD